MFVKGLRRRSTSARNWFNLSEFAATEKDLAAYRDARAVDTRISGIASKVSGPQPTIDWSKWEDSDAEDEPAGFDMSNMGGFGDLGMGAEMA